VRLRTCATSSGEAFSSLKNESCLCILVRGGAKTAKDWGLAVEREEKELEKKESVKTNLGSRARGGEKDRSRQDRL